MERRVPNGGIASPMGSPGGSSPISPSSSSKDFSQQAWNDSKVFQHRKSVDTSSDEHLQGELRAMREKLDQQKENEKELREKVRLLTHTLTTNESVWQKRAEECAKLVAQIQRAADSMATSAAENVHVMSGFQDITKLTEKAIVVLLMTNDRVEELLKEHEDVLLLQQKVEGIEKLLVNMMATT
jgi:hypothetical protein